MSTLEMATIIGYAGLIIGVLMFGIGIARFKNWVKKLKGYSFKRHLTLSSVVIWFVVGFAIIYFSTGYYVSVVADDVSFFSLFIPSYENLLVPVGGILMLFTGN
jgi:uncharacterized membrane protein YidH (DUF202 family)